MALADEDTEHTQWLAEVWEMIADCAVSLNPRERISLSTAGCAALIAERRAQMTPKGADLVGLRRVADHPVILRFQLGSAAARIRVLEAEVARLRSLEDSRRPAPGRHMNQPIPVLGSNSHKSQCPPCQIELGGSRCGDCGYAERPSDPPRPSL